MKKITDYLKELGLTEIEAELYQGLLETGPTTVMGLSELTKIKRITVHFNVENLIKKGLVTQTIHGSRRQIMSEPPEKLKYLIEQKLDHLKNIQTKYPDFLNTIKSIHPQTRKEVEIKYYEEMESVMHIYNEALKAKEFRAYVNTEKLHEVFTDNMNLFIKTHSKRHNMYVWEIMQTSPEAQRYISLMPKKRYYYKLIPEGMNLSIIDYMIFDGKVAIVNIEKYTTGILISNEHYYNNAKALFNFVWQMLP